MVPYINEINELRISLYNNGESNVALIILFTIFITFSLDTEDYLEVITATDSGVSSTGNMSQRKETEDLPEASISTVPLAVVVPTEIPCEVSNNALLFK